MFAGAVKYDYYTSLYALIHGEDAARPLAAFMNVLEDCDDPDGVAVWEMAAALDISGDEVMDLARTLQDMGSIETEETFCGYEYYKISNQDRKL